MRRLGSFRIKPRSRLLFRTVGLRFLGKFMDSCDLATSFHCRRWSRPTVGMGLARPTAGLGLDSLPTWVWWICWLLGLGFFFFFFSL
jgi:hypothetical protein